MKKFVYIASPYTVGDNFVNVQRQIETSNILLDNGFIAISPLINSVFFNMQKERHWEFWMNNDFELLKKCDCVYRLEGESKGADLEIEFALQNSIPVFYNVEEINLFFK